MFKTLSRILIRHNLTNYIIYCHTNFVMRIFFYDYQRRLFFEH